MSLTPEQRSDNELTLCQGERFERRFVARCDNDLPFDCCYQVMILDCGHQLAVSARRGELRYTRRIKVADLAAGKPHDFDVFAEMCEALCL